jgi:hypothetical protein
LEFDLQIQGLIEVVELPEEHPPLPLENEVNISPQRVYAMADDATLLVKMEIGTLTTVKNILEQFEVISGLGCNVEKTALMQIGDHNILDDEIRNLGFDLKTTVTILGMEIKNVGKSYEGNIEKMVEKVRNQVRFWTRFGLSLPGRINVAKTFMYSQLTYLGCLLPMNNAAYDGFATIIGDYVNGPLRISKKRIFLGKEYGGLGLMNVKDFLEAQNCVWVKRAQNLDDNWKVRLYRGSYGSLFNLHSENFDKLHEPLVYNIAKSFERFSREHMNINENFRKSFLYGNRSIVFEGRAGGYLTSRFLPQELRQWLQQLKVEHFIPPGWPR